MVRVPQTSSSTLVDQPRIGHTDGAAGSIPRARLAERGVTAATTGEPVPAPTAALAPLRRGDVTGDVQLERVGSTVTLDEAVALCCAIYGDTTDLPGELDLCREIEAYNANRQRGRVSFATWLALRGFANENQVGVNDWAKQTPLTPRQRDTTLVVERNLERALKRLAIAQPHANTSQRIVFAVKKLRGTELAKLVAQYAPPGTDPSPGWITMARPMTAAGDVALTECRPVPATDAAAGSDAKVVVCVIERADGDAGVAIDGLMPQRAGEVIFPAGTRLRLSDIDGDPNRDDLITMVFRTEGLSEAERESRASGPDKCWLPRRRDTPVRRYQTPAAALSELRDLCYLAELEPRRAVQRLFEADAAFLHAGHRLAERIAEPGLGEHVVDLATMHLQLLSALVRARAMKPLDAIDWVAAVPRGGAMTSLVNVIATRWSSAAAAQLVDLFGACIVADPASRTRCARLLAQAPDASLKTDRRGEALDNFFYRVAEAHMSGNADGHSTLALDALGLIPRDCVLERVIRATREDRAADLPDTINNLTSPTVERSFFKELRDGARASTFLTLEREAVEAELQKLKSATSTRTPGRAKPALGQRRRAPQTTAGPSAKVVDDVATQALRSVPRSTRTTGVEAFLQARSERDEAAALLRPAARQPELTDPVSSGEQERPAARRSRGNGIVAYLEARAALNAARRRLARIGTKPSSSAPRQSPAAASNRQVRPEPVETSPTEPLRNERPGREPRARAPTDAQRRSVSWSQALRTERLRALDRYLDEWLDRAGSGNEVPLPPPLAMRLQDIRDFEQRPTYQ